MLLAVVMDLLAYLNGALVFIAYITYIFKETGSYLSEKDSSILVSITQITSNIIFISIVERFNRRVCNLIMKCHCPMRTSRDMARVSFNYQNDRFWCIFTDTLRLVIIVRSTCLLFIWPIWPFVA